MNTLRRATGIGATTALLLLTGCGAQPAPQPDGLPDRTTAAVERTQSATSEEIPNQSGLAPESESSGLESFSIEYALGQLPRPAYTYSRMSYTVADMEQVFSWLGPVEDVWLSESHQGREPDEGDWFWAANAAGSKPPPEGSHNSVADFILGVHPEYFGEGARVQDGFQLGIPLEDTKVVAEAVNLFQLYVQLTPDFTVPPGVEDLGEGLYLVPPTASSFARNSAGHEWRLGVKDEEMLLHPSAADAREWLLGDTAGTLSQDATLMETAALLDELGLAVAHIYPSPRHTRLEELRESRDENRDEQLEELLARTKFKTQCEAAAIGWFDQDGEPREVVVYHFGDAGTASATLSEVETVWSDDATRWRVRDIRQEDSLVYVVLDDLSEFGTLARALSAMASDGDEHFICGAESF